jgi:hypothetical protein
MSESPFQASREFAEATDRLAASVGVGKDEVEAFAFAVRHVGAEVREQLRGRLVDIVLASFRCADLPDCGPCRVDAVRVSHALMYHMTVVDSAPDGVTVVIRTDADGSEL